MSCEEALRIKRDELSDILEEQVRHTSQLKDNIIRNTKEIYALQFYCEHYEKMTVGQAKDMLDELRFQRDMFIEAMSQAQKKMEYTRNSLKDLSERLTSVTGAEDASDK